MIEIGGKPILWHIMKMYSAHGIDDFVICCGYKGYVIKEYFANYFLHTSDVTFDMAEQPDERAPAQGRALARDAGRYRRRDHDRRPAQARRRTLLGERRSASPTATAWATSTSATSSPFIASTASWPPLPRYNPRPLRRAGLDGAVVRGFAEKPRGDGGWINGGFFVLSPRCIELDRGRSTRTGKPSRWTRLARKAS